MEFYKTIKKIVSDTGKIAVLSIIGSLPYICEGCEYSAKKVNAAEIRPSITQSQTLEKEVLITEE